jgi:hypothetical protein
MVYLKQMILSVKMEGKCIEVEKLVAEQVVEVLWLFVSSERKYDLRRLLVRLCSERNEPSMLA